MAKTTIKQTMIEEFRYSLYDQLLHKYVDMDSILDLGDREKIEIILSEGKWDDGTYYLERRGASLYFYRAGCFKKIVIANEKGVYSFSPKQFYAKNPKIKRPSGLFIKTMQWQRFFAMH